MTYQPSQEMLEKYADVLIKYALDNCTGVKPGQTVLVQVPECAKPMLKALRKSVLTAGANPIIQYIPDDMARETFELASDEQLKFFPESYLKGLVEQIDHSVYIIAETNPTELAGIGPKKLMMRQSAYKPYAEWRDVKENQGKFTWTLAMYATQQMADEAGLSLEEYWGQIIDACFLNEDDPIGKWKQVMGEVESTKEKLNELKIQSLHVVAENTDLTVQLGDDRQWMGGSGRNIPSFEIFISPDWRGTNGHIQFTEPLYFNGNLIRKAYLEFKDGLVTKATAEEGEEVLKEMIATKNANKIGEYSLTDKRHSRITKFMAETLFDENVGGEFGNTHLAVGKSYQDSYPGDIAAQTDDDWKRMGYNNSAVHTDIVATSNRTVTATLKDGSQVVIYKNGQFQFDE